MSNFLANLARRGAGLAPQFAPPPGSVSRPGASPAVLPDVSALGADACATEYEDIVPAPESAERTTADPGVRPIESLQLRQDGSSAGIAPTALPSPWPQPHMFGHDPRQVGEEQTIVLRARSFDRTAGREREVPAAVVHSSTRQAEPAPATQPPAHHELVTEAPLDREDAAFQPVAGVEAVPADRAVAKFAADAARAGTPPRPAERSNQTMSPAQPARGTTADAEPRMLPGLRGPTDAAAVPVLSLPQAQRETRSSEVHAAATEARPIQVRIGKVEIRAASPPQSVRALRSKRTSGFAELALTRAHLGRTYR
jgi:hypothetical protein